MARKGVAFNFAKRAKDLKKQQKRQEKLERKRGNAASGGGGPADDIIDPPGFESLDEPERPDESESAD